MVVTYFDRSVEDYSVMGYNMDEAKVEIERAVTETGTELTPIQKAVAANT